MNNKNLKKNWRRKIIIIFFSFLVIVIVIIIFSKKKCIAFPGFKSGSSKPNFDSKINIKELKEKQQNMNFFRKNFRKIRLTFKNLRRRYFKRKPYPFDLNKNPIPLHRRPLSDRTMTMSKLIQQRDNERSQLYKFYLPLKYQNTELGISNLFNQDYTVQLLDAYHLLPYIYMKRGNSLIGFQTMKKSSIITFSYQFIKNFH